MTKLVIYKTLILPVPLYGAKAWTLLSSAVGTVKVFERKILRKIFGLVQVGDDLRIRYNSELYELLNDMEVVQRGVYMEEVAPSRRIFDGGSTEVGEEDNLVSVRGTKSRNPCHRLM